MRKDEMLLTSNYLGRDMNVRIYGSCEGYPILVFPTQNAMANQFEEFGMIETLADFIDEGLVQLFCVDSVDADGWTSSSEDPEHRSEIIEAYYHFVVDELLDEIHDYTTTELLPITMGCALGASHAAIMFLRRPELFQACICLSGIYDASYYFGGWMNGILYENSPVHFLGNMPEDHEYVDIYNNRDMVFCVGQGAWEDNAVNSLHSIEESFRRLGVEAWCDWWGFDVSHDWYWWKKQARYFLPIVLDGIAEKLRGA
ncbi:MAG: esterase family protein [Atopobiaceae bacterium]|nr:esterase family protein [Atopobiaceae bacterium]